MNEAVSFTVKAHSGDVVVRCPICEHDKFRAAGPADESLRKQGFQHVVLGLVAGKHAVVNPVRFMHCDNCGFIIQMMIQSGGQLIGSER